MSGLLPEVARRRLDPGTRYGLRLTLFLIGICLVAIPFTWLVVEITSDDDVIEFDMAASEKLFELKTGTPWLSTVLNAISLLGHPVWFWILIGGVSIYLWVRRRTRLVAFLMACTLGGAVLNRVVKIAVSRPRPGFRDPAAILHQEGMSFPSGHAMTSTIAYGALLLIFLPLIPRRYRRWALGGVVGLVTLIGASRLGLGVHYVSDVAGGFILGLAWLIVSTAAFSLWRVDLGRRPVQPLGGVEPEARRDLNPTSG